MNQESSITVAVRIRPFTPFESLHLTPTNDTDVNLLSSGESDESDDDEEEEEDGGNDSISNIAACRSPMPNGVWKLVDCIDDKMLVFDPVDRTPLNRMSVNVMNKRRHRRFKSLAGEDNDENKFMFDRVFDMDVGQEEVYTTLMHPLLDSVMQGYNGTIFAYGATGCGKTYTISGSASDPGIIYRTMEDLYGRMEKLQGVKEVKLCLSFCEIYNENILDLLRPETPSGKLVIREDGRGKIKISNLSTYYPVDVGEVLRLVALGNMNRTTHATEANNVSSRSHSILQISIEQVDTNEDTSVSGVLSIIDLAGSERAAMTKNRGTRLIETGNINKSLLALGNCINALCQERRDRDAVVHVPYRDSKLTRLLQFSLGGNCKTVMIVCISPSSEHYDETLNTLKYANRAKEIKTKSVKNENNVVRHVGSYVKMIQSQRETIQRLMLQVERLQGRDENTNDIDIDIDNLIREQLVKKQQDIIIQSLILVKRRLLQVIKVLMFPGEGEGDDTGSDNKLIEEEINLLEQNFENGKNEMLKRDSLFSEKEINRLKLMEENEILVKSSLIMEDMFKDDDMRLLISGVGAHLDGGGSVLDDINIRFNQFSERYLR